MPDDIYKKIKDLRVRKDITQLELAQKLNMSQNNYSRLERGDIEITIERLRQIAVILELPIDYFFREVDEIPDFYLLPIEEQSNIKRKQEKDLDLPFTIEKIQKEIYSISSSIIDIEQLRFLSEEIHVNAKKGLGLVYLEYDIIRGKFKAIYRELRIPFNSEIEINDIEENMNDLLNDIEKDEKVLSPNKRKSK